MLYKYIMSAGDLDKTFNSPDGYLIKQYTSGQYTGGFSVAIDSNGRLVVTGLIVGTNDAGSMFVTRYLADGTPDTDFAGGVIFEQYTSGKETAGVSVAIDSNNRVVVTGYTVGTNNTESMFVTRYLADGTLDTDFAGGVIFEQYTSGKDTGGSSVAIDSNNRVVVTGYTFDNTDTGSMFVTRYLADGTPDTDFAGGVIFEQYTSGKGTGGTSVAIDSNNRVIVTGQTFDTNDNSSMFITRYLADGTLDTDFAGGVITEQYTSGKDTFGRSVAIDSNDRVVVTGYTVDNTDTDSMFVTRYLEDGTPDTGFAGGVIFEQYTSGKNTAGLSVAIDSNDRIIVTGYTSDNTDTGSMFITRYLSNGDLDTNFSGGVIFQQYTSGKSTVGIYVTIDSSGRIVVTGETQYISDTGSMFLTRYLGDNATTTTTTITTLPPTTTTTTTEPICLVAGTPILTDQGIVAIEKIDTTKHTINNKRIVAVTKAISPEKHLVCFEANSMGINCPTQRTIMTPGHEVLYKGKLVQSKHFVGRVTGVHTIPYNGKDVLYNVLQEQHGLMRVNNMVLETLHPENKVAKELLKK